MFSKTPVKYVKFVLLFVYLRVTASIIQPPLNAKEKWCESISESEFSLFDKHVCDKSNNIAQQAKHDNYQSKVNRFA